MKRRQCEKFLLAELEEDIRNFVYNLWNMANEEYSLLLRLLSLIRYAFFIANN